MKDSFCLQSRASFHFAHALLPSIRSTVVQFHIWSSKDPINWILDVTAMRSLHKSDGSYREFGIRTLYIHYESTLKGYRRDTRYAGTPDKASTRAC
jgi:hypothetical protein